GMHRLGIAYNSVSELVKIFGMQFIEPCGMYTHLCCSDSLLPDDIAFTKTQIDRFYGLVNLLKNRGISIPKLHIQSSYGLLNYPDITCDYVRCGIALYGVQSTPDDNTVMHLDLRPVLSVKSKVIHLLKVPKGEYVGYGRAFLAERDSVIAVLSIGYGDGIPRTLSCGNGSVLIGGQYAPIVGRISMDQLSVDITDIANVSVGDTATIISDGTGSPLSAPTVAAETQSISNELLSRLSTRLYKNA
ncbi:MAG TPA: alanine racemase, partial [Candidatus Avimonoglobus intestinipullorum]|nr:alanine racemase [Candidatus Avimonoglobus intestinipullorum]